MATSNLTVDGTGWGDRVRHTVSALGQIAFLVWLYDITDGAAFSPFSFVGDVLGGSVWQPLLVVLGLGDPARRAVAIAVRSRHRTGRQS